MIALNVHSNVNVYFNISDALIGVHCTHGVNRTGYLICRYLIEKLDWDPQKAIDSKIINFETVSILNGKGIHAVSDYKERSYKELR